MAGFFGNQLDQSIGGGCFIRTKDVPLSTQEMTRGQELCPSAYDVDYMYFFLIVILYSCKNNVCGCVHMHRSVPTCVQMHACVYMLACAPKPLHK